MYLKKVCLLMWFLFLLIIIPGCNKATQENPPSLDKQPEAVKTEEKRDKTLSDFTNYRPQPGEVVRIIDPDNGPGTDYTSLNDFNDAEKRDLLQAQEIAVALCRSSKGSPDKPAQIEGWVTSEQYYVKIIADEGHRASARWDDRRYRIIEHTTINSECLDVEVDHILVDGIQMLITGSGKSNDIIDPERGQKYIIRNCYMRMELDNSSGYGIDLKSPADIYNCVIQGSGSAAIFAYPGAEVNVYNNTLVGWTNAIKNEGSVRAINNIAIGASGKVFLSKDGGAFTADSDYNSAEYSGQAIVKAPRNDIEVPWHLQQVDQNEIFMDPAHHDFRLKRGSVFENAGVGPETNPLIPATDIEGRSRSGALTSLGADVAGG